MDETPRRGEWRTYPCLTRIERWIVSGRKDARIRLRRYNRNVSPPKRLNTPFFTRCYLSSLGHQHWVYTSLGRSCAVASLLLPGLRSEAEGNFGGGFGPPPPPARQNKTNTVVNRKLYKRREKSCTATGAHATRAQRASMAREYNVQRRALTRPARRGASMPSRAKGRPKPPVAICAEDTVNGTAAHRKVGCTAR